MSETAPFVVALVDDDDGVRSALGWLLRSQGYDVREFGDGAAFVQGHDIAAVGCALIDLRIGAQNGLDCLDDARGRGFDAPAIVISAYGDIPTAVRAVQQGAFGFIEKPVDNATLLAAVADACRQHVEWRRVYGIGSDAQRKYAQLTEREADVYWLLTLGATAKDIAAELDISVRTAETHRARVMAKFGARGVNELAMASFHLARK